MSYKISKELFEAVMSLKVIEFYCRNEIQYYPADKERVRCIDWIPTLSGCEYNDFFFKCKEWLIGRGYDNWSGYHENEYFCYVKTKNTFISNSEQQAVFDATDYVRRLTEGK